MKLFQEMEDPTNERKFVKSQVEKRRRERMNRSLERLRTMLLKESQQLGGTQRRVEKAEILEQTVLFLQSIAKKDHSGAATAAGPGGGGGGGGGGDLGEGGGGGKSGRGDRKHSFQDGISTCLQRAAHFLGPEGKGLWLGAALDASFCGRLSRPDSDSATLQRRGETGSSRPASPLAPHPHTKSILRLLRQKSEPQLQTFTVDRLRHPYRPLPQHQAGPGNPHQAQRRQNRLQMRPQRQTSKTSPALSLPGSQSLWRPWS